jgi:hypothetical protein
MWWVTWRAPVHHVVEDVNTCEARNIGLLEGAVETKPDGSIVYFIQPIK